MCLLNNDVDPKCAMEELSVCAFRKNIYSLLHSKTNLKEYGSLLRCLMEIEIDERSKTNDTTYDFECFYWCAFLLSRVGKVSDIKLLGKAKFADFDSYMAFDVQFLVGAGIENTISFLATEDEKDILEYILKCKTCGDFDDLDTWYAWRYAYFKECSE